MAQQDTPAVREAQAWVIGPESAGRAPALTDRYDSYWYRRRQRSAARGAGQTDVDAFVPPRCRSGTGMTDGRRERLHRFSGTAVGLSNRAEVTRPPR